MKCHEKQQKHASNEKNARDIWDISMEDFAVHLVEKVCGNSGFSVGME